KVAVADHVFAGADRLCPACATPNGAKANCCMNCGSPLEAGKAVNVRRDQVHAEGQVFAGETAKDARDERARLAGAPGAAPALLDAPPTKKGSFLIPGLALGALVLMALLFATCFWKKPVALTVTAHAWERSIQIEQMQAVSEAAWCSELPPGATDVTRT